MKRDYKLFLNDIKESVVSIENYISGKSLDDFEKDFLLQDAVIRRIQIIGEAVKNIPRALKEKNKDFPWHETAHLRDIVVHYYHQISMESLWRTLKARLPVIKEALKNIKLI